VGRADSGVERAGDKQLSGAPYCRSSSCFRQCRRIRRPKMRPAAVRDALQNQSKGGLRNGESFEIIRISSWTPRPLGSTSVNVQNHVVGRPGPDPGILGVFPESPGTTPSVQICWLTACTVQPTSTTSSTLNSWRDSWLDQDRFKVKHYPVTRVDGEGFGCDWATSKHSSDDLRDNRPVKIQHSPLITSLPYRNQSKSVPRREQNSKSAFRVDFILNAPLTDFFSRSTANVAVTQVVRQH